MDRSVDVVESRSERTGCESGERFGTSVPLTRVFIDPEGNLLVTDLWEPVWALIGQEPPKASSEVLP